MSTYVSHYFYLATKVFLRSHLIMNGVCVLFVGWLNIIKLDGVGYLTFDEERSQVCKLLAKRQLKWSEGKELRRQKP